MRALNHILKTRSFTCIAEVLPPRECLLSSHYVDTIRQMRTSGAHVFSVASNPMGSIRMESAHVAQFIQNSFTDDEIPTIVHLTCRGRSMLQHQSHLLALHASGIQNLLIVEGDDPKMGDCPQANNIEDMNTVQFIELIKHKFQYGVNSSDQSIGQPVLFSTGCAVHMQQTGHKMEWNVKRLHQKIEAGADFCMTQPIFDLSLLKSFIERYEELYGSLHIPIIAGILPVKSSSHIASLKKIPGLIDENAMDNNIMQLLSSHTSSLSDEEFAELSFANCHKLIEQMKTIHTSIKGIYVTAGLQAHDMALRLLQTQKQIFENKDKGNNTHNNSI